MVRTATADRRRCHRATPPRRPTRLRISPHRWDRDRSAAARSRIRSTLAGRRRGRRPVLTAALHADGRPIRYRYVPGDWPLERLPDRVRRPAGQRRDAERGRGRSPTVSRRLVARGIGIAPITLHTGVSSLEGHELPYAERFEVPPRPPPGQRRHAPAATSSPSAPPSCGRSRRPSTPTAPCIPADGWTDARDHTRARACGPSTAW